MQSPFELISRAVNKPSDIVSLVSEYVDLGQRPVTEHATSRKIPSLGHEILGLGLREWFATKGGKESLAAVVTWLDEQESHYSQSTLYHS